MTKQRSTTQKSSSRKRTPVQESEIASLIDGARGFFATRSQTERTALATGAIGFLALSMSRTGRGILKRVGGFVLPIAVTALEPVVQEIIAKKLGPKIGPAIVEGISEKLGS